MSSFTPGCSVASDARSVDAARVESFRAARDYEGLEMYIVEMLLGTPLAG